jgi:ABC-type branched-subunit amino acid transport system substrate-binding protein
VTRLRVGACLSLSGRYARFGQQAAVGLQAWQSLTDHHVELLLEDDGSDPDRLAARFVNLAPRCDLLLGPYSTQLMRVAGRAMADLDMVLWNHGGSGDDVQAMCPGRIVSVLAPTSRYAEPFVNSRASESDCAPLWVVHGRGRFGRQVAAGAVRLARELGIETVERPTEEALSFEEAPESWDLFSAGTFEDDVAIVGATQSAARPARAVCSIAAGVHDFASMVDEPDGIYGIAQWFAGRAPMPKLGPHEDRFVAAYLRRADAAPDYPAVQAAAAAAIAAHCAEEAGSLDSSALWAAAARLRINTLLGEFGIDAETGMQTEHELVLLRWHGDQLRLAR